jgi:hypothetical protein
MIKFENPTNGRYYYLEINTDALNDLVLTIIRGGARSRVVRHFGYNCQSDIEREIERICKVRLKRGYVKIN